MQRKLLLPTFLFITLNVLAQIFEPNPQLLENINDRFGTDIAVSGDFMAISSGVSDANEVYIYQRDGNNNWNPIQTIGINDSDKVRVAMDGTRLLVGAISLDGGKTIVYNRGASNTYTLEQELLPSDFSFANPEEYGWSVDISGNFAIVGSLELPGGAVYFYEYDITNTWIEISRDVGAPSQDLGWDVAIEGTNAVSGTRDDVIKTYAYSGSWTNTATIDSPDSLSLADVFGYSVDIEGSTGIAGAILDPNSSGEGAAYFFEISGGSWINPQRITPNTSDEYFYGKDVDVHGDKAVVGYHRLSTGEAVYDVFESDISGNWILRQTLSPVVQFSPSEFEISSVITDDNLFVGIPSSLVFNPTPSIAGRVYIYEKEPPCEAVAIPDPNFEQFLLDQNIDTDAEVNGQICRVDAEAATNLFLFNLSADLDLTGIEAFINLNWLFINGDPNAPGANINNLNINTLSSLNRLDVFDTGINSIDVSGNTGLTTLNVYRNQLSTLDVSNNTNLQFLDCRENNLTSLDITNNLALIEVDCSENQLSVFDVGILPVIQKIDAESNQLPFLDVSGNSSLLDLNASDNLLTTANLIIDDLVILESLNVSSNDLDALDLTIYPNLLGIGASYNNLTSLDFSNNPLLINALILGNLFISLDFSGNPNLEALNASENQLLENLDLRNGNMSSLIRMWTLFNPNLLCIEVDDVALAESQRFVPPNYSIQFDGTAGWNVEEIVVFKTDCAFDPNAILINNIPQPLSSFSNGVQDKGTFEAQNQGSRIKLSGNAWKKADLNYTVTPNTIIEFDLKVTGEGEIHGIGLDNDDSFDNSDRPQYIQLGGTQVLGVQTFNNYSGTDWKSYSIPVGQFTTGNYNYLVFVADKDNNEASQESFFRNIVLREDPANSSFPVNGVQEIVGSYSPENQDKGASFVEDNGSTLRLVGNTWKSLPLNVVITPNTVMEFEMKVNGEGEIHAIGFDEDNNFTSTDASGIFQFSGTQTYGIQDFNTYSGNDWQDFSIPIGQFFLTDTGYDYIVFIADKDDEEASQESLFRNVVFYEETNNQLLVNNQPEPIGSYDNGGQDQGGFEVLDSNTTVRLFGNSWKSVPLNYVITENTILEFEFKVTNEGEIQGIGLDDDNLYDSSFEQDFFQLAGTQIYGIQDFNTISGTGWNTVSIAIGDFITGDLDFDYLTFVADKDVNGVSQESFFRNIQLYEGGGILLKTRLNNISNDLSDEVSLSHSVRLFPNEASEMTSIVAPYKLQELAIFDMAGAKIREVKSLNSREFKLYINNIPNGLYIVKVRTEKGLEVKKLVIRR